MNEELPEYPASLPQYPLRDSLRIQPEDNVARSPTDTGPGKQRPRSRLEVIRVRCATKLPSRAALEELLKFHRETLKQGSQRFAWTGLTDNIPNGTYEALQFAAKPSWQPAGATAFRVEMELLALPADPGIYLIKPEWLSAFVDFSRNSEAWFFNSAGLLEKAAINVSRFNYDPADGTYLGFLRQRQWTNNLKDPRDPSTAEWTGTATVSLTTTGIDGVANTAAKLEDTATDAKQDRRQQFTIANDSNTHTILIPLLKQTGKSTFAELRLEYLGGTTTLRTSINFNTEDGNFHAFSGNDGSVVQVRDWGDWWAVEIKMANNGTGNTTLSYRVFPVATDTITDELGVSSLTGSIHQDFPGVYLNTDHAPYTPVHDPNVSGAAVTQSADDAPASIGAELAADGFTLVGRLRTPKTWDNSNGAFSYNDGTGNNIVEFNVNNGNLFITIKADGVSESFDSGFDLANDSEIDYALRVKDGDVAISVDGATPKVNNSAIPSSFTQRDIASRQGGNFPWGEGHTVTLREIPRPLTNQQLQTEVA